jgi:hypothetical protein
MHLSKVGSEGVMRRKKRKTPNPEKDYLTKKRKNPFFFEAVHVSTAMKSQSASNRRQSVEMILYEVLLTTERNLSNVMNLSGHGKGERSYSDVDNVVTFSTQS